MAAAAKVQRHWYRTIAPHVTVKTGTPEGVRVVALGQGAPLPFDVPDVSLQHHISHHMVEEYPLSDPEVVALAQTRGLPLPAAAGLEQDDSGKEETAPKPGPASGHARPPSSASPSPSGAPSTPGRGSK